MRNINLIISISIFLFLNFSCKKNQMGGKSDVQGTVYHHSKKIADAKIYIKYNSKEFPGTDLSVYDTYITADENGRFHLNFYKGQYYLFSVGKDYGIPPPYNVVGGVGLNLRTNEDKDIDIYITEGD